MIFQSGERGHDEHTRAGTLEGWQSEIAARAVGNPLLLLALSASFRRSDAGALQCRKRRVHLFGDSSTGKTTVIEARLRDLGRAEFPPELASNGERHGRRGGAIQ